MNIYRIVKSHKDLVVNNSNNPERYFPIIFLLAVIVGCGRQGVEFVKKLRHSEVQMNLKTVIESESHRDDDQNTIFSQINDVIDDPLFLLPVKEFNKNSELIMRFSFHSP